MTTPDYSGVAWQMLKERREQLYKRYNLALPFIEITNAPQNNNDDAQTSLRTRDDGSLYYRIQLNSKDIAREASKLEKNLQKAKVIVNGKRLSSVSLANKALLTRALIDRFIQHELVHIILDTHDPAIKEKAAKDKNIDAYVDAYCEYFAIHHFFSDCKKPNLWLAQEVLKQPDYCGIDHHHSYKENSTVQFFYQAFKRNYERYSAKQSLFNFIESLR